MRANYLNSADEAYQITISKALSSIVIHKNSYWLIMNDHLSSVPSSSPEVS